MRTTRVLLVGAWILMSTGTPARAEGDDAATRRSVVKVSAMIHPPNLYRPWAKAEPAEVTGSGVVIAGKRVLTNAHVVNRASQVFVEFAKSGEKFSASPIAIAPGIDLAVLRLEDDSAFQDRPALPLNEALPSLQQAVFAYGFPKGGSELSITRGIVSRVEFTEYYCGVQGLRVQIDAAINPGNSGGPVVADGKMIGLAFSRLESSDNIGYVIPAEEIALFLKDVEDGHYDGKPMLAIDCQTLENPTLRAALKLDRKTTGIVVRKVNRLDPSYPIAVDDIVTKVGDHAVDDLGMVRLERDQTYRYSYLIQRLTKDGRLPVTVLRKGVETRLDVPVDRDRLHLYTDLTRDPLSYFIFGPLVFTEASEEYIQSMAAYSGRMPDGCLRMLYTANPAFTRYGDQPRFPDERIVIVPSPMFSHRIARGYSDPYTSSLAAVNGVKIRGLRHLVETLRDATGPTVEFSFAGQFTDRLVFNRKDAIAATEDVLNDNGIRQQCSADLLKVWDLSKGQ